MRLLLAFGTWLGLVLLAAVIPVTLSLTGVITDPEVAFLVGMLFGVPMGPYAMYKAFEVWNS